MSDAEIHPELPLGSPILAYGTSRPPRVRRMLLAIAAGIFVVLAGAIAWLWTAKTRMPDRVVSIAAVRAGTQLPDGFPLAWKDATRDGASSLLGFVLTEHGLEPFALTLGSPSGAAPVSAMKNGRFTVLSEQPIAVWRDAPLTEPLALLLKTLFHPAYLRVDPSAFGVDENHLIEGPIDAHGNWNTNTKISGASPQELPSGNIAIDASAFPEAWPIILRELRDRNFDFEPDASPVAIGWSVSSGTTPLIDLRFAHDVSSSTILSFASAAGLHDVASFKLLDDTVVDELRLPENRLASTSSDALRTGEGSHLEISGTRLSVVPDAPAPTPASPCSEGRPLLRVSREAIDAALFTSGVPLVHPFQNIEAVELNGKLQICTN